MSLFNLVANYEAKLKADKEAQAKALQDAIETGINSELKEASKTVNIIATNAAKIVNEVSSIAAIVPSIILNDQQQDAIETFMRSKYGMLIGYAGTGKTTTVKELIKRLLPQLSKFKGFEIEHLSFPLNAYKFAMCAFTGMAVKQIRRSVSGNEMGFDAQMHCYTIHKLLDYGPVMDYVLNTETNAYEEKMTMVPRRTRNNKLNLDLVIVDEVSMLSQQLFAELLDALPSHCRILAIGDIAQLPPVFGQPIMPLMLSSWPVKELTKIYRQKDGSLIDNANKIRSSQNPIVNDNFKMLKIDKNSRLASQQVISFLEKAHKSGQYDPLQDIVLTTNNNGDIGQELINVFIRGYANPGAELIAVKTMRNVCRLAVGDRVMNTKNDANLGIYNGQLGWIKEITSQQGFHYENERSREAHRIANEGGVDDDFSNDFEQGALGLVDEIAQRQAKEREEAKLAGFLGKTSLHTVVDTKDSDPVGTAKRAASHIVTVAFDNADGGETELTVLSTSSQIENLIPAWCTTVHKAQGSGFRNVFLILHDAGSKLLVNELLYTAITRAIENVTIFTTKFAFAKALKNYNIEGTTLDAKLTNYLKAYSGIAESKKLRLPIDDGSYYQVSDELLEHNDNEED
jgi:ATP-dependent exoDNAse (exonuclease V) alpha subunit